MAAERKKNSEEMKKWQMDRCCPTPRANAKSEIRAHVQLPSEAGRQLPPATIPGRQLPATPWRQLPPATRRERERGESEGDNRLHSLFALHAPIHWAMLGVCDQEEGVTKSLPFARVPHESTQVNIIKPF